MVSVDQWAAWAPGIETSSDWSAWVRGDKPFGQPDSKPVISFVKPMARRRMSRLSRMSLEVAEACRSNNANPFYVFCSRYGEYSRTGEALRAIVRGDPMSPAVFSGSVHNTSAGHFTILHEDQAPTTTVTAGEATLEAGMLEAWTALKSGRCTHALVVYHDEPLPDFYGNPYPALEVPLAAAFSVRLPEAGDRLALSWRATSPSAEVCAREEDEEHPVLGVLRLLLNGSGKVELRTARLTWEWRHHAH